MDRENPVFLSLEVIESRITEKLTVENIANGVYFSKYHYMRLFREIVGHSVMEYVTKRKLTLAGRALLETDASILDIALDFGYESRDVFTRCFKAYMGVTPSEYRKYGLATISQKIIEERTNMTYSKTTDEIIRELNEFIVKAKETAEKARKCEISEYTVFWKKIADVTDDFAGKIENTLEHISAIGKNHDDITEIFKIIKVIEDVAFKANLVALNTGLMVSRGQPNHVKEQWPFFEMYLELARSASGKCEKITALSSELTALIFADMRKAAAEKIAEVIRQGNAAVDKIVGYDNIKFEVENVVMLLSEIPVEKITISFLEECVFKLQIISFAASMEACRESSSEVVFDQLNTFKDHMSDALGFFESLAMPENEPVMERTTQKFFQDVAYQGNLLLFYLRGEVEKMGRIVDEAQRAPFLGIYEKVNDFIQLAHNSDNEADYKPIADKLYAVYADMTEQASILGEKGGVIKFIAVEFKGLADAVMRCDKE